MIDDRSMKAILKASSWKVMPEDYSDLNERSACPVLRSDLESEILFTALRTLPLDDKGNPVCWKERLDLYTKHYDFGKALHLHSSFIRANNLEEILEEIARRGLYVFDAWGYAPSSTGKQNLKVREHYIDKKTHNLILKKLGKKFLGWDNGEHDGRFIGSFAFAICPAPAERKIAFEKFRKFFVKLGNDNANYLNALCSLTFPHYYAHLKEYRLLGAETAQGLPSVPMWYSFIRGAGKQYGILWFGNISVFNRWGFKTYDREQKFEAGNNLGCGPYYGTTISLLKRLWFIELMYGSVILGIEQGHIPGDDQEKIFIDRIIPGKKFYKKPHRLTPIGRLHLECAAFSKKFPDLGIQHTPVALIFDFYSGWTPPRHLYGDPNYPYMVWGNMPYSKGDHQIDLFFRKVFPGYEDSGFFRDERGFLTSTPYGDIFDVFLSNVSEDVLSQYSVAFVLGETLIKDNLREKLKKHVRMGGSLVIFANQVESEDDEFLGWKGKNEVLKTKDRNGEECFINHIEPLKGNVLVKNAEGFPLVIEHFYGKGKVITVTAEYGLSKNSAYNGYEKNIISGKWPWPPENTEKPLPSPYNLMEETWESIAPILEELLPIKVEGSPVQYIINITSDPSRFYVLVSNNEGREATVSISSRRGRVKNVTNLFSDEEELVLDNGISWVHIPALNLVIFEIVTTEPCIEYIPRPQKPIKVTEETHAHDTQSFDAGSCIESAHESGAAYVGLRYNKVSFLKDRHLENLRENAKNKDVTLNSLYLSCDQSPYFEPDISNVVEHNEKEVGKFLESTLDIGIKLGVKTIVFSGGCRYKEYEQKIEQTKKRLVHFSNIASAHDIETVLVNHHMRIGNSANEIIRILEGGSSSNLKAGLDIGHTLLCGKNVENEISMLGKKLNWIYLNRPSTENGPPLDAHLLPDDELLCRIADVLKNTKYDGKISLNIDGSRLEENSLKKRFKEIENMFPESLLEICIL